MLQISNLVTLKLLLRFQIKKRRNETTPELTFPIRNLLFEWEHRRSILRTDTRPREFDYSKSLLSYFDLITCKKIELNIEHEISHIEEKYSQREEEFHLFEHIDPADVPEDRLPAPGITLNPRRYHSISSGTQFINEKEHVVTNDPDFVETPEFRSNIVYDETVDLSGQPAHPAIEQIIREWFPEYVRYLDLYCRPSSYGPQAFKDFNRPTPSPAPPTAERHEQIMEITRLKMAISPYRPLHFVDALAAETPLSTSASYSVKYDPRSRVLCRYSAPVRYKDMPTSKGYAFNVVHNLLRTEIHHVKYDGMPFPTGNYDPEAEQELLDNWFAKHPTQLFIRTQISLRDPNDSKKIRPVYCVDMKFLHVEKMLTTPLLAQMRNPQSCVAHGLETFRGAMALLNMTFLYWFSCFASLDWSQYDQRLPRYVIIAYYLDFLASLLIVSHGYMPSRFYESSIQPIDKFASKIFNLLCFLLSWYLRMTFLSFDGFAYIRQHGGVPSGLLNTQSLDSFGNMYIISDCLLEFGFTISECLEMLFCVLGDDNLIFMKQNFERLLAFMTFLEQYAQTRHGMVLSVLKSAFSTLRTKITFLSYENNDGLPARPIGKLVAQLAFPERPVSVKRQWIHAARALGLAYANCGQNQNFHLLCKIVYERFKPTEPVPTHHVMKVFKKFSYSLKEFDIEDVEYTFPTFPTCASIQAPLFHYAGPFSEMDKWNTNMFEVPPSDNLTDYVTLKDYILTNPEMSQIVREFWLGTRS
jgi:hypothetical protein